jgi:hypothetical protein
MFTPVDPAIKERIVSAFLAGQGRNQIDRELRKEGIQVSHGSISNVIIKYKKEHEQLLQKDTKVNDASTVAPPQPSQGPPEAGANISTSFPIKKTGSPSLPGLAHGVGLTETVADKNDYNTRVATHPEEGPDELQFKEDSDISLEDHIITNTKDWQENGYRLEGSQKGGPLSWFRNGSTKESEKDPPPSSIPPEVNVNNNDYNNNNNYVIKEDAALKEKERIDKCQPAAPDSEDKRPPIVIKRERYQRHHEPPSLSIAQDNEPIISLGIDWDSDTLWEKKFIHYIMEDKKQRQYQLQLIEQQQAALNQETGA